MYTIRQCVYSSKYRTKIHNVAFAWLQQPIHRASRTKHLVHYNIYNSTFVGNPITNSIWKRITVLRLCFCFWQLALLRSVNITFDDRYMRRHLKWYTIKIILCLIWLLCGYESFPVFTFSFFFLFSFWFSAKKNNNNNNKIIAHSGRLITWGYGRLVMVDFTYSGSS